jgi:hypothetical protein
MTQSWLHQTETLPTFNQKVPGSNLCRDIDYPEAFRSFSQFLQGNVGQRLKYVMAYFFHARFNSLSSDHSMLHSLPHCQLLIKHSTNN